MEDVPMPPSDATNFIVNPDGSITADEITIPPPPVPELTVEATKERLIITELAVRDFKSYAGEKTIGPFNKNFSCIVGPNGSGKSNVIDALLFVFGYRAQKIRSKKVSVLIHKSHKFPDLGSCSVTVHFATIKDEGTDYTVLPDSQFCVTRTGYKDNSSTYEINGRRVQYKDVANLLRKYSIDLDYNRFMILQGEIELISMMKPKGASDQDTGMLEYIEDIIGSNRFIKPIQHFNSKVEETNERRIEKLNQLKLVEKERADAEKPRNKAMEYLSLSNKLTLLENSVLQTQIVLATEETEKLAGDKDVLTEKINSLSTSLNELQSSKQAKEEELKNIASEYDARAKSVEDFKQQFTALEKKDVECRENIKNVKEKSKKHSKTLEAEEKKISSIKKQPDVLKGEIDELEGKREKMQETKKIEDERLIELMGSVKDEIKDFQEEKDKFEEELVGLKTTVNEKKSELDLAQSELNLLFNSEKKEKEKLDSLEAEYDKTISLIEEEAQALQKANERIPELHEKLASAKEELLSKEEREVVLTEELKTKRIKYDEAKNSITASENKNKLTKAFMEQKKNGKLLGVYGRLGDLGAISAKYDVAVSTACGALDHFVTDSITTAQECVQFLKANDLGYATFIALDEMKRWEQYTKEKITTPENVPRLFDLITVKDKDLLKAFYFALRDTLVADSLDQATRVGLQGSSRHRVVTLKGELIDTSGTMSGGGGKQLRGRMGQSVCDNTLSQKEVEKMANDIDTLVNELAGIKDLKFKLREIIEESNKEIATLQRSFRKSQLNHDGYLERRNTILKQTEEQKLKIVAASPDKQSVAEIQQKINKHEKSHNKATSAALVVENKVKELQDKILSITKGKYGTAQKKIDKLMKEIDQVTQNITKNTALLKNCDKNLKKAESKIESTWSELEACDKSMEGLKQELKELESEGLEVSNQKKAAEEALLMCEVVKATVTGEVKGFSTKIHDIKSEVIERKNQAKLIDIDIRANQGHLRGLKSQLSKLELHKIDDEPTELPTLTPEEMEGVAVSSVQYEIGCLQAEIKEMNPDLGAIAEFKRKEEMYKKKLKDLEDTLSERDHYRQHYENLRKHRLQEFMRGFNIITLKVKELYQMLTLGGDAELELVDSIDPFSEGIEFSVRPLRKSWKSIRNLSGGEKTLSSLSLVFALHYYRTTPFFVMDEIDAALDFRNVSIIGSYIKDCTKNAQFIVISLRENMFMLADHLIGIYKTNNRTKNVYLNPPPMETEAAGLERNTEQEKNAAFDRLMNSELRQPLILDDSPQDPARNAELDGSYGKRTVPAENSLSNVASEAAPSAQVEVAPLDVNSVMVEERSTATTKSLNATGKENVDLSRRSNLKTPKRKRAAAQNESKWSDDDDFVIGTPSTTKRS